MWRIMAFCIMVTLAVDGKVSYEGYKVFSAVPRTQSQLELLQTLKKVDKFSYWQDPSWVNKEVRIMVSPRKLPKFYEIMNKMNIDYTLKINNVQKVINDTMPQNQSQGFDFKSYHTIEEIYANLDDLAKQYPDKVQVVVAGSTYEGREIKGVKIIISNEEYPGIFIEGGIHAREWISPATVMYILHKLLTSQDPQVRYIADYHNWFIFPIFNPDGYAYTFSEDRLWKKTRKPSSFMCVGSDPNRNWDIRWNTSGVDSDPCAEDYPGNEPFSEIEMKAMSQYIICNSRYFYVYVSFHSFAQQLLFPYAYTREHIFHYDELHHVGSLAIEALKERYVTQYITGCVGELQGEVSGLSTDYVAKVLNKRYVYTYELRSKNRHGFILSPRHIIPTGEETLDSLVTIINNVPRPKQIC